MTVKVPVRTVYDNSNNAIGLSEFQSDETIGYQHGGTGLTALGSANQVLKVNSEGTAIEWAADSQSNLNPYLQVANANVTFVTKSTALASNNSLINLINDRMQVANVSSLVLTEVSNLVDSAPVTLNTLNELAAALGDDANFAATTATTLGTKAANTYVNQTFETKEVALSSNSAQNVLINDRIQVANARVEFLQSSNTSVTNDATSITVAQSTVNLNDRALINPAGFITINIGGTEYKLPFFS